MIEHVESFFVDLGVECTVCGAALLGIFDDAYIDPMGIAASSPSLLLSSPAATSAALGDPVTVGAVSYTIAGIEPDGTGMTRLRLAEA